MAIKHSDSQTDKGIVNLEQPYSAMFVNINPAILIPAGIVVGAEKDQVQQVGIDLTVAYDIEIPCNGFRNIQLNEKFNMQDCFGMIFPRSSWSRMGVFISSGLYDPGFTGIGGVSIYNLSNDVVHIKKGMRIGQIVCFHANFASKYTGHYNHSPSIDSKITLDQSGGDDAKI